MCDRRYCGCVLRGVNLIQFTVAAIAALALAGAAATVLQDLLDALLIGLPVLIAGVAAGFVLQVRSSRKRAIRSVPAPAGPVPRPRPAPVGPVPRPRPVPVVPAPRPAHAVQSAPRPALDVARTIAAAALTGERDAAPG